MRRKRHSATYAITTDSEQGASLTKGYHTPPKKIARRRLSALPVCPKPRPPNSPYPVEQEDILIARARLGDSSAGNLLLLAYNDMLCREAKKWFFQIRGHDLDLDDLVQSARMGLMHALHKFDRSKGTFAAYATVWAKQHCVRIIQNEGYTIRVPVHKHQALSKFERDETDGTDETMVPKSLREVMSAKRLTRLDEPLHNDDFTSHNTRGDMLRSPYIRADDSCAKDQLVRVVREVVADVRVGLSKMDLAIIDRRLLTDDPEDMATIGRANNRSRERVRQRESELKVKFRLALKRRFAAADVM